MNKPKTIFLILVLYIFSANSASPQGTPNPNNQIENNAPKITITLLDVNDTTLKLSYRITNNSENNIWILCGLSRTDVSAEVFMGDDGQTLIIRRRLDVPFGGAGEIVYGRYVLLQTGKSRVESVMLPMPVKPDYCFESPRKMQNLESATKVAIETGYYDNDLPDKIFHVLKKTDEIPSQKRREEEFSKYKYYFKGSVYYNKLSEGLRQRNEEIYVPYTYQWFGGEKILRTTVETVRIPYKEGERVRLRDSLNIPECSKIKINFKPSILDYFFPFESQ